MPFQIREEDHRSLEAYGTVPMTLTVDRRVRVVEPVGGTRELVEAVVNPPWVKDYDADAGPPSHLGQRWDLSNWGVLSAFAGECRVGGALVAWRTDGVEMLDGRDDVAVLWDLRVHPAQRRRGLGSLLLEAVTSWALRHDCTRLDVETQDINVPACRLYAKHGFRLLRDEPGAYPSLPGEIRLLFSRALS